LRWDDALQLVIDDSDDAVERVRTKKQEAREKSGDFMDAAEEEEEDEDD
jgi:hypothetical protein